MRTQTTTALHIRVACCSVALGLTAGCAGSGSDGSSTTTGPDSTPAFVVTGNPESTTGATWAFKATVDGVAYDLTGVLYKPVGPGPFPAVVLSHGSDGNAAFLIGSPGTAAEVGASSANILRAHMAHELLRRLSYVDMSRVAAHGHSLGAYLDVAEISTYPSDFRVASHTSGGVRPAFIVSGPAPTVAEASVIHVPYQIHHGDADTVVALSYEQRFDSVLTAVGTPHQYFVYPGASHTAVRLDPVMLQRVHDWYASHGMF